MKPKLMPSGPGLLKLSQSQIVVLTSSTEKGLMRLPLQQKTDPETVNPPLSALIYGALESDVQSEKTQPDGRAERPPPKNDSPKLNSTSFCVSDSTKLNENSLSSHHPHEAK